jgi:hypothetical protein
VVVNFQVGVKVEKVKFVPVDGLDLQLASSLFI